MQLGTARWLALSLSGVLFITFSIAPMSRAQEEVKKDDVAATKKDDPAPTKNEAAPLARKQDVQPHKKMPQQQPKKEPAPPTPASALLKSDAWKDIATTPLQPGEIDQLLEKEFAANKVVPSPLTTDEQFLRRIHLDLTGQLPSPEEIKQFVADTTPDKRAKLIDKLLETDEYARHWARYWRDTVSSVDAPFGDALIPAFDGWLYEQFKQNRNWGEIVRSMLMAEGNLKKDDADAVKHGNLYFLGRFTDVDGDNFRTAETARVFLGIQIQCAQCHNDRRTKIWHQVQFHALAGFFARMAAGGSNGGFIKITTKKFGEHTMPSKEPDKVFVTYPQFLDGQAPPNTADDAERRKALADYVTSSDNYWFSATFTNRMCGEMFGQPFFERVDDLSPKSKVLYPGVINRLAAAFKGSKYDIKSLLRSIANSNAYQRQARLGESTSAHLQFASVYPVHLRANVFWDSLTHVLGQMPTNEKAGWLPFKSEFNFDPSCKADEVTGSIGQALWMLNSAAINDRVKCGMLRLPPPLKKKDAPDPPATPPQPTLIKQVITKDGADDSAVINDLYLQTLARNPSAHEMEINLQYIKETQAPQTREQAVEDIFKVLINSTEFQRRR